MKKLTKNTGPCCRSDEELADVLVAISVVSKRLARKLAMASGQNRNPDTQCRYMQERSRHKTLRG